MIQLSNDFFKEVAELQEKLDDNIRVKKEIDFEDWLKNLQQNHILAYRNELSEFINEIPPLWKYWKNAPISEHALEEAIDVIHFAHLLLNKQFMMKEYEIERIVIQLNNEIKRHAIAIENGHATTLLNAMYNVETANDIITSYAGLLAILDHLKFDLEQIKTAYYEKNKENHNRQANGY